MHLIGAKEWAPSLKTVYEDAAAWEVLHERWGL